MDLEHPGSMEQQCRVIRQVSSGLQVRFAPWFRGSAGFAPLLHRLLLRLLLPGRE